MNNNKINKDYWQGILPRRRSAIIFLAIIAVVAFSLGGLLLGGNSDEPTSGEDHNHAETVDSSEPTMWTCSMHPQIKLPKPGKCPICFMDLIPVENGSGVEELNPNQIRMSETAVELANIQTTPVTKAIAKRFIRMVGKLAYDETKVSYITAWVPGRLDKLFIDYTGAEVKKGDHMVHIYSPELIAAQEELLQAKKAVGALNGANSNILKSTAQETLKSAREKLRLLGLSENQIDKIERENEPSDHLTISAPSSGVVVHKDAKEGMYVTTGTKIYTIVDLSRLWVLLEAYESDLSWLRLGQKVTFTSPSFPGETFEAEISFIDPVVDPKSRTVDIRAIVDNSDKRLKPDMFVSGVVESQLDGDGFATSLNSTLDKESLLIPSTAPLITGKRAVVYVEIPGDDGVIFEGREVTLGPRAGDLYVVKEGLKEGEKVVTNGAFKIDSELQIQAKPSMMSPEGGPIAAVHNHGESGHSLNQEMTMEKKYIAGTSKRLSDCEEAQKELVPVYRSYFDIQMALANDDLDATKQSLQKLSKAVTNVDMGPFKDKAHSRWMEISGSLIDASNKGKSVKTLSDARDIFYHLSQTAIELHDTFGHAGETPIYLTFCPMARNNNGAYWLQEENIVWNSFYGEAMLRCGEIKKELVAGNESTE